MSLSFQNAYTQTAYVALVLYDSSCGQVPWRKSGWYGVAPGTTVEIFATELQDLPDLNWAWFADCGADGPSWSGDPSHAYQVPHNAGFNQCYADNTNCNATWDFHAAAFSSDWSGLTVVLVGPGAADQPNQGCAWAIPVYAAGGGGGGGGPS